MRDATGGPAFAGDMLIEGNKIRAVSRTPGQLSSVDAQVIDADGMFLMPGMTEGHGHISFEGVSATEDLIRPGPEEQVFAAARGAKALIDMGFTSVYGASEAKLRLGVAVRNEIAAGRMKGPRIRAGGLEISVTGAMGDESTEHNPRIGPSTTSAAAAVSCSRRSCIRASAALARATIRFAATPSQYSTSTAVPRASHGASPADSRAASSCMMRFASLRFSR